MAAHTLKKRSEFLAVRGGLRWSGTAFLIEGKKRSDGGPAAIDHPRFGFTVTKKLGGAVVRNRIRRRLKAAVAQAAGSAERDFDYVLVARPAALERPFAEIARDLARALGKFHQRPR